MTSSKNTSKTCPVFQDSFSILTDPGRSNKGNYTYPLNEILFLAIASVISGMDNQTAINNFGKIKLNWLRLYFPFESGIPSHDVLGDVFAKINNVCLGQQCVDEKSNEITAIPKLLNLTYCQGLCHHY